MPPKQLSVAQDKKQRARVASARSPESAGALEAALNSIDEEIDAAAAQSVSSVLAGRMGNRKKPRWGDDESPTPSSAGDPPSQFSYLAETPRPARAAPVPPSPETHQPPQGVPMDASQDLVNALFFFFFFLIQGFITRCPVAVRGSLLTTVSYLNNQQGYGAEGPIVVYVCVSWH